MKGKSLSHVQLFVTPWTVAYQALPSMGFSRQEYWSGLPFPSPGDLPDPGIEPGSPALEAEALTSEPPGKPRKHYFSLWSFKLLTWFYKYRMVRWHHWLSGQEFKQTPGDSEGQGSLAQSMGSQRVGHNWATKKQKCDRTFSLVLNSSPRKCGIKTVWPCNKTLIL